MFSLLELYGTVWLIRLLPFPKLLCKLQRKEPGWLVGEHIQVFFGKEVFPGFWTIWRWLFNTEIDRLGESDRSNENRTDAVELDELRHFTLVGEVDLWTKPDERAEKVVVEEANFEEEEEIDLDAEEDVENLPDGEVERSTGPLDRRPETAIVVQTSE